MVFVGKEYRQTLFSAQWPCGVCGKGVQANSVQCTVCKNGFTNGAVVCVVTCRGWLTVSGVDHVMGQSRKVI